MGWYPNDNKYMYATSFFRPWSTWKTFADPGRRNYDSQVGFLLPLDGEDKPIIYMKGRWTPKNLARSTYVWLPIDFDGPPWLEPIQRVIGHFRNQQKQQLLC